MGFLNTGCSEKNNQVVQVQVQVRDLGKKGSCCSQLSFFLSFFFGGARDLGIKKSFSGQIFHHNS